MMTTAAEPETLEVVQFSKARFEGNELILDDDITHDEWKDIGHRLKWAARRVQFCIGDWARFGEKKGFVSKVYDELEILTGLERKTIQNYKHVAEATSSRRREDLSFSHHAEVASLPPKQQIKFLELASEEKLLVKQLRKKIQSGHDEVEVIRKINRQLDEEWEGRAYDKDQIQKFDATVKELLQQVNSLPLFWRKKLKQGLRSSMKDINLFK